MRLAFMALVVTVLVFGLPAHATTYSVMPDGSGDFATIQMAVIAAINGDVIELGDGTFTGPGNRNINFGNKLITVRSQSLDPSRCIIDCEAGPDNRRCGFRFGTGCGRLSVLEGVTIQHGYDSMGGGIYVDTGQPTIRNCILRENTSTGEGGGLRVWGGSPLIERCQFIENSAPYGAGAAASVGSPDHPTVFDHCVFVGNYGAIEGGGVRF
jgi:hypothetical protein